MLLHHFKICYKWMDLQHFVGLLVALALQQVKTQIKYIFCNQN